MFFSDFYSNEEFLHCYPESTAFIIKAMKGKTDRTAIRLALRKHFLLARIVLALGKTYFKIKQYVK